MNGGVPAVRTLGFLSGELFRLAWRNIWRNRRRSLLTLASISLGLAALLFMQSMIKSLQAKLVDKATAIHTGHVQIQAPGVKDLKIPDVKLRESAPYLAAAEADPGVAAAAPRVSFTGLIASSLMSKGVLVISVDPAREGRVSRMPAHVTEGTFLAPADRRGIVIGEKLARTLDVRLGERVVLMVQSEDGSMGADAFRVRGIYRTGSESFDGQLAYIALADGQALLGCGTAVTAIVILARRFDEIGAVRDRLAMALAGRPVEVKDWRVLNSEITGVIEFQDAVLGLMLMVIFLIVAVGIANTLLMALYERIREFGLMLAMGATRGEVARLVVLESLLLGALGLVAGGAAGAGLIAWFGRQGIVLPLKEALSYMLPFDKVIYLSFAWPMHLVSAVALFVMCALAAVVPALRAARLKPVEALRHL